ncbi:hypothetical protein QN277_022888 [Acacia crassicarpa]|uniref:Uncharacterized protein n=1 Tax=Acacia crassicarpa TaxID=499986 RepID=A0AAE1JG67_9FABA|nr:hypothetical protein QN277_022888 [Acacia crassicarpa]
MKSLRIICPDYLNFFRKSKSRSGRKKTKKTALKASPSYPPCMLQKMASKYQDNEGGENSLLFFRGMQLLHSLIKT